MARPAPIVRAYVRRDPLESDGRVAVQAAPRQKETRLESIDADDLPCLDTYEPLTVSVTAAPRSGLARWRTDGYDHHLHSSTWNRA
jgi:hypothetical protein